MAAAKRVLMYEEADKLGRGNEIMGPSLREPPSLAKQAGAACRERCCAEKRDCLLPALALETVRC